MSSLVPAAFGCVSVAMLSITMMRARYLITCGVLSCLALYCEMAYPSDSLFPTVTFAVCSILVLPHLAQWRACWTQWLGGLALAAISEAVIRAYAFRWWSVVPYDGCLIFVWCAAGGLWPGRTAQKRNVLAVAGLIWPLMWLPWSRDNALPVFQSNEILSWLNGFWLSVGLVWWGDACQTLWGRANGVSS